MTYAELVWVWKQTLHSNNKKGFKKYIAKTSDEDLIELFLFLFPQSGNFLSRKRTLSLVANELDYPVSVFEGVVEGHNLPTLIASESQHVVSEGILDIASVRTLRDDVVHYAKGKSNGEKWVLDMLKNYPMDEAESRLFWHSVMNERGIIRMKTFLYAALRNGVRQYDIDRGLQNFSAFDVLMWMIRDPMTLGVDVKWNEQPGFHLLPRRYWQWASDVVLTEYNGGTYQVVPDFGKTAMTVVQPIGGYDLDGSREWLSRTCTRSRNGRMKVVPEAPVGLGVRGAIIEHTLGKEAQVVDIFYLDEPDLNLHERMERANLLKCSTVDYDFTEVIKPLPIPSWDKISSMPREYCIRFPNVEPFEPSNEGGYMLIKDSHVKNLRLKRTWKEETGEIKLLGECLDGDEFMEVAEMSVPLDDTNLLFNLRKLIPDFSFGQEIPEEKCIVLKASTPFFCRNTLRFANPVFLEVDTDLGMSDVEQFVDLMHGGEEE